MGFFLPWDLSCPIVDGMTTSTNHTFLDGPYKISERPRPQVLAPLSKLLLSFAALGAIVVAMGLFLG